MKYYYGCSGFHQTLQNIGIYLLVSFHTPPYTSAPLSRQSIVGTSILCTWHAFLLRPIFLGSCPLLFPVRSYSVAAATSANGGCAISVYRCRHVEVTGVVGIPGLCQGVWGCGVCEVSGTSPIPNSTILHSIFYMAFATVTASIAILGCFIPWGPLWGEP